MAGRVAGVVALAAVLGALSCNAIVGFSELQKADHCVKECAEGGPGDAGSLVATDVWFGRSHTCASMSDKSLMCWGGNSNGQLGVNDTSEHLAPVRVRGLTDVSYVALGQLHTCAVTSDGKTWCWGSNSRGQLGDGTNNEQHLPKLVTGLGPARKIQAGKEHTCAEMSDGTAQCWGSNVAGELGDGTNMDRSVPTPVKVVAGVKKLSSGGGQHNCAVVANGTVLCWGSNDKWQLGARNPAASSLPIEVGGADGGFANGSKIWVGFAHSCVLKGDATVWCWGANDEGQLGNNSTNQTDAPVQVLTGVANMGAGWRHTCASSSTTNDLKCWGTNDHGQLGIAGVARALVPTLGPGLATPNAGTKGENTCALVDDAGLLCWGWNDQGQVGDGTKQDRPTPTAVKF
jgi:alpha-tubulin suppressor-like RCC1 family protein